MRAHRLCNARGRKARVDVLLSCTPRRLADRHWGARRQSAHLEYETDPQPRCGAVGATAEVAVHAHDAHRPRARRAVGALRPVARERERRRDCDDLGLGPVSGSLSGMCGVVA